MPETKSSVVSIMPFPFHTYKPAIFPGDFSIPKADDDDPQVIHVGDSWHTIYLGVERGYLKVTDLSYDVARAIVDDFKRSVICTEPGISPGLFWVPKIVSKESVEMECANELLQAREEQRRWYDKLIMMADDDWTKSNHMHRSISDLQRLVAKKLGLDKEWIFVPKTDPSVHKCPACFSVVDEKALICANCRLILKPDQYNKLQFAKEVA